MSLILLFTPSGVGITASLDVTLGEVTLSGQADVDIGATLDVTLDDLTLSSDATVGDDITAIATITLGELSLSSSGDVDIVADSAITLEDFVLSSLGDVDIQGDSTITLDALTLVSEGGEQQRYIECTLVTRDGAIRPNLTALSWAWFDNSDPVNFIAPTDTGEVETTDGSGVINVLIPNTTLGAGQIGTLVLRSDDGTLLGAYNLEVS